MKVFLSWSGPESEQIAGVLHIWLRNVIQALRPWLSKEDIRKGGRGGQAIGEALRDVKAGIICVTPSNQESPWLNFESGAISKALDDETLVCTFLHGLSYAAVKPPLSQFQHTDSSSKVDVLRMLSSINRALEQPLNKETLDRSFEQWWPDLEAGLKKIQADTSRKATPQRTAESMLEELLDLARDDARRRRSRPVTANSIREALAAISRDTGSRGEALGAAHRDGLGALAREARPAGLENGLALTPAERAMGYRDIESIVRRQLSGMGGDPPPED